MLPQMLEGQWEDIRAYDAELAGHRVRLTLLTTNTVTPPVDAPRKPNQAMLDALREVEKIQEGMTPKRGADIVDVIREGRAGAMYHDDCN